MLAQPNGKYSVRTDAYKHAYSYKRQSQREYDRNARNTKRAQIVADEDAGYNIVERVYQHTDERRRGEFKQKLRYVVRFKRTSFFYFRGLHFCVSLKDSKDRRQLTGRSYTSTSILYQI
jgi:hypothetical protein